MTRRYSTWLKVAVALGSAGIGLAGVVWVEHLASQAVRDTAWNSRGYRGAILGAKDANEVRIVALGASTTFGYGVLAAETYPTQLERRLREVDPLPGTSITLVNLGMLDSKAVCLEADLRDYGYLEPDMIIVYSGYNGGGTDENQCRRQASPVFQALKFFPIAPIVLLEKWYVIRYGNVAEGYARRQKRLAASMRSENVGASSPGPLSAEQMSLVREKEYEDYKRSVLHLVDTALGRDLPVLFVYQVDLARPSVRRLAGDRNVVADHQSQQQRIRQDLRRYENHRLFRTTDAGELFGGEVTPEYFVDWMHLNGKGNDRLAEILVDPVADLLALVSQ